MSSSFFTSMLSSSFFISMLSTKFYGMTSFTSKSLIDPLEVGDETNLLDSIIVASI